MATPTLLCSTCVRVGRSPLVVLALVLFALAGSASAATNINACGTINGSDTDYYLTQNIAAGSGNDCLTITGSTQSGITIHCGYYDIAASSSGGHYAVKAYGNTGATLKFENCSLTGNTFVNCGTYDPAPQFSHSTVHRYGSEVSEGIYITNCYYPQVTYSTFTQTGLWLNGTYYASVLHNSWDNTYATVATYAGLVNQNTHYSDIGYNSMDSTGATAHTTDDGIVEINTYGSTYYSNTVANYEDCAFETSGTVNYLSFTYNTLTNNDFCAIGGFNSLFGTVNVTNSTFDHNTTHGTGSMFVFRGAGLSPVGSFTNNTLSYNTADTNAQESLIYNFASYSLTATGNVFGPNGVAFNSGSPAVTDGGGNYCGVAYPIGTITCH